jgi:hypothetical protein
MGKLLFGMEADRDRRNVPRQEDQFCGAVRTIYWGTFRPSRSLPSCLPTTEAGYD